MVVCRFFEPLARSAARVMEQTSGETRSTARFEMLREGVQECEARIFVQTALDSGNVPAELAARCSEVLSDRDEFLRKAAIDTTGRRPWFASRNPSDEAYLGYVAGWQEQSERLYDAAAEVAALTSE